MTVYFISGLGADSRIFKHIQLPDYCNIVYLDWIVPEKNESLTTYASRLSEKIDTAEPFILVGLSLGGMMAIEISNKLKPVHTILISSIQSSKQRPPYFNIARALHLPQLAPPFILKKGQIFKGVLLGYSKEHRQLLVDMLTDALPGFLNWGMNAVLSWNSKTIPPNLTHIHGTKDIVLPARYTTPTHLIRGAGHIMILSHAKQVNKIINEVIESLS